LAIGNRKYHLPARLNYAWDLTLQCQLAETNTAQTKLPEVGPGTATAFAPRIGPHGELRFSWRFRN